MKRAHVFVTGTVQGVHFRDSARRQARQLNVRGWVRNLPDGRVEAVFEGTPFAVDTMVAWCWRGPDRAQVRHVDVQEELVDGEPPGASAAPGTAGPHEPLGARTPEGFEDFQVLR